MKIIQISDLHMLEPGKYIGEINPLERLKKAIDHINHYQNDAEFCVVSGDITDTPTPEAYKAAKQALDNLYIPYYAVIGNHDLREPFLQVFTGTKTDSGFINYSFAIDNHVFVFLDTVKEHSDFGELCKKRMQWLKSQMNNIKDGRSVYLFMHHPAFSVTIPCVDKIMLRDNEQFYEIIKNHPVKYLFFGHVHRPSSGIWRNIPYSSNRSIGHYQLSTHNEPDYDYPMTAEAPMYSVITITNDQTHIDMQDFMNDEIVFQA